MIAAMGKLAYGVLFTALLPAALVAWAWALRESVTLPAWHEPTIGWLVLAIGVVPMMAAWVALWQLGRGLPMNAFPPERYVDRGIYGWLADPIYVGAVFISLGASVIVGSAAGLWVVTPTLAFGCATLVIGYERPDLLSRFGHLHRVRISLPPDADAPTSWSDTLAFWLIVLLPWLIVYEAILHLGPPAGAVEAFLPMERSWAVVEWTELIYFSSYIVVPILPLLIQRQRLLRRLTISGIVMTVVFGGLLLVVPLTAPPRAFEATTVFGRLLLWERSIESAGMSGAGAFPSFHAGWAVLVALTCWQMGRSIGVLATLWAVANIISCVTTGQHAIVDVLIAIPLAYACWAHRSICRVLLRGAERLANSFAEVRVGAMRVISHAMFSFAAGATGATMVGLLAGGAAMGPLIFVAVCGLLGAAIWLQVVLRGSGLSRPFGYHGFIVGACIAIAIVGLISSTAWVLFAALSVSAPIIQSIGRLRCLVQGCCHGRPTIASRGIRVAAPQSRVCYLAHLSGQPILPTPLFSILANLATFPILLRLWTDGAPCSMIAGAYLIIAGLTRFSEESFRGEPKTPRVGGLHVFHWAALLSIVLGAIMMIVPSPPAVRIDAFDWRVPAGAAVLGLLFAFCMSCDFPSSTRRFSRLAPTREEALRA